MRRSAPLLAAAALVVLPSAVHATSYVLPSDAALADRAEVIARVRVDSVGGASGRAALEYAVTVERLLKGDRTGTLTVRVPGNPAPRHGHALRVDGAPVLRPGQRALLFLHPNDDGTFRVVHLVLGAFVETRAGGMRLAVRDLGGAIEARSARDADPGRHLPRDLARFETWLADRSAGVVRAPDYLVSAPAPSGGGGGGPHVRWFRFEGPRARRYVDWLVDPTGQEGVPNRGREAFRKAVAAWTRHRGSTILYRVRGSTDSRNGLDVFDSLNTIIFEVDLGDPFDCEAGGLLAIGGAWFEPSVRIKFGKRRYSPIEAADVVVNENIACFFESSPDPRAAAAELYAHELGHTLGLRHSCGDRASGACRTIEEYEALMRAFVHDDGRGAFLEASDKKAVCGLYPDARLTPAECAQR